VRFLVVVHPPVASPKNYALRPGVTARFVDAPNAQAAADKCDVEPGGKAQVIAQQHVETFTRAEKAPLVSDRPTVGRAA
jgi:hypothetical protein